MSTNVTTAFVEQYKNNVALLVQQKGSRLRNSVTVDSAVVGKNKFTEQIGATAAVERTSRHGDSPLVDTPHARRRLSLTDYEWGDLVDDADKVRMLIDPTSSYAQSAAFAMGRTIDDVIISALGGTASTGVAGGTSTALPSSQIVTPSPMVNLTLDVLRTINEKFQLNDIDPEEDRYLVTSPKQITKLLADTNMTSADYNTVKALVDGDVDYFMGLKYKISNSLTADGSNVRDCFAWVPSGLELGIGADIKARISERPDKAFSTYVYYSMSIGATRLEEEKVVKFQVDDDL